MEIIERKRITSPNTRSPGKGLLLQITSGIRWHTDNISNKNYSKPINQYPNGAKHDLGLIMKLRGRLLWVGAFVRKWDRPKSMKDPGGVMDSTRKEMT